MFPKHVVKLIQRRWLFILGFAALVLSGLLIAMADLSQRKSIYNFEADVDGLYREHIGSALGQKSAALVVAKLEKGGITLPSLGIASRFVEKRDLLGEVRRRSSSPLWTRVETSISFAGWKHRVSFDELWACEFGDGLVTVTIEQDSDYIRISDLAFVEVPSQNWNFCNQESESTIPVGMPESDRDQILIAVFGRDAADLQLWFKHKKGTYDGPPPIFLQFDKGDPPTSVVESLAETYRNLWPVSQVSIPDSSGSVQDEAGRRGYILIVEKIGNGPADTAMVCGRKYSNPLGGTKFSIVVVKELNSWSVRAIVITGQS